MLSLIGRQISVLRLRSDADVVLDRGFGPGVMTTVLAELTVKPGTYWLESWQRLRKLSTFLRQLVHGFIGLGFG